MAFRYSGTNWEGRFWRAAGSIVTFGDQIMAARMFTVSYPSDGTVASKTHDQVSPNSDHRPKPTTGPGVVRAIDFYEHRTGFVDEVFETIRTAQDPRCLYCIHDERMFSSYPTSQYPAWTWRPYGGTNGHITHGHMSVVDGPDGEQTHPWPISPTPQGDDDMWTRDLDEAGWRALARAGIAAGGEGNVVDYWVTNGGQRTLAEHQSASSSMLPLLLANLSRLTAGGGAAVDSQARETANQAKLAAQEAKAALSRVKSVL